MDAKNKTIECKSKEGVIIGLLDTIMNSCKILCDIETECIKTAIANNNKKGIYPKQLKHAFNHPAVIEALKDFNSDSDVKHIIVCGLKASGKMKQLLNESGINIQL